MAELTIDDVEDFAGERTDDQVQAMLDAALTRARRHAEWFVSPVVSDQVTVDGPGGVRLYLPTRKIVSVEAIVENAVPLDPTDYTVMPDGNVILRNDGCWTREYAGIAVTYTHGFTESEAADWRRAILLMVDQMSRRQADARSADDLVRKRVDDVEYQWTDYSASADRAITSVESTLDKYCLAPTGFA